MELFTFTLTVVEIAEHEIVCHIHNDSEKNSLSYAMASGAVSLTQENRLAASIRNNHHQLQKILRSAIDGELHLGQTINCVFITDFHFLKEQHFKRFIRLDRRKGNLDISVNDKGLQQVHKIYADGSSHHETKKSGYGGFIETPEGTRQFFLQSFADGSSNLMELLAVTKGLRLLRAQDRIQVNTDSRFVIRGLVQWVHFWKHNKWQTAHGRNAKYQEHWQEADALCAGKLIEFRWIKGHSGHDAQVICHNLAKAAVE